MKSESEQYTIQFALREKIHSPDVCVPLPFFLCFSPPPHSHSCLHFCFPVRIPALSFASLQLIFPHPLQHSLRCSAEIKTFPPSSDFQTTGRRDEICGFLSVSNKEKYLHRVLKQQNQDLPLNFAVWL